MKNIKKKVRISLILLGLVLCGFGSQTTALASNTRRDVQMENAVRIYGIRNSGVSSGVLSFIGNAMQPHRSRILESIDKIVLKNAPPATAEEAVGAPVLE